MTTIELIELYDFLCSVEFSHRLDDKWKRANNDMWSYRLQKFDRFKKIVGLELKKQKNGIAIV